MSSSKSLNILPSLEKKYPLDVSFSKFHVTRPNRAGYNKIYDISRSKSFFFELVDHSTDTNEIHLKIHTNDYHMKTSPISYPNTSKLPNDKYQISVMLTHFFSLQRVLPRRIQQKFFNFIRDKLLQRKAIIMSRASKIDSRNTTTKNFFNFSYKRYRFHFGIYIPCSHDYITPGFPGFSPPKTICKVPTPFIMSDFRRACVLHQPSFFKNDVFIHIKNVKKELNVDSTNASLKSKIFHANLLYTHWNTHRTKKIYSRRLGISYEETIHARDRHSITHLNNKHIYRKKLCNLSIRRSHNPSVSKAQETRFDRAKRRIFNTKEHNRMDLIQHKYATAQRYRFLFSETQFVLKSIKHLLYNQGLHHGNYKFWTPFFGRPGKRFMTTTIDDTLPSLPLITYTVAPYNPTPNMFIPHKYRNIIPKEPLYTEEGVYIVPGSREWFTYMYNLHNNLPPPLTKAQRRALQRENERIAHFRLNQENAIMQGTSVHRVRPRQFLKDRLSTFCERVHDKMMKLTTQYLETDNEITKSKVYKTMSNYCTNIFEDDNIRSNKHMRYGNQSHLNMFGVPVDTSDDAKELELRPKKRRFSSHTTNLYPSIDNTDRFKRRRLSPAVMDDSTGVKIH